MEGFELYLNYKNSSSIGMQMLICHNLYVFRRNLIEDPRTFTCFEIPPLNFKNSQFSHMNFQLFLIWTIP